MTSLKSYIPSIDELTVEQVTQAKALLRLWIRSADADLDAAENTPFSDLYIKPAAYGLSAMDTAVSRLIGDHDLQNIAIGGAYNCDVAMQFVKNFSPLLSQPQYSRGYVRLVFDSDTYREIDRGIQLQFSVLDGVTAATSVDIFYPLLFSAGPVVVRPSGSTWRTEENCIILKQLNDSEFAADIPVYGAGGLVVPLGTEAALNHSVDGLLRATAVGTFTSGSEAQSLTTLAKKATTQVYASSLNTRFGAVAFLQREFPDLVAASATVPGDREMVRETVSALGIAKPTMDVWVKGKTVGILETARIRLTYYRTQGAVQVNRFIGRLSLPGFPMIIEDIQAVGASNVNLGMGSDRVTVMSSSLSTAAPRLSCAHSADEVLHIGIRMPFNMLDEGLVPLDVSETGVESAVFEITYRSDSAVEAVGSCLRSQDVAPVNVGVLTRGMIPIWVKSLNVRYRRNAGAVFKAAQAKDEIVRYINSISYPETANDAYIADSVRFAGGSLVSVTCSAVAVLTLASRVASGVINPLLDWSYAVSNSVSVPVYQALTLPQANFDFMDPDLGTESSLFYAVGPRNSAFFIDGDNIQFEETR